MWTITTIYRAYGPGPRAVDWRKPNEAPVPTEELVTQ